MADEVQAQDDHAGQVSEPVEPIYASVDYELAHMVKLANVGLSQDVTLFIKGHVVTGTLVSGRKYFLGAVKRLEQSRAADGSIDSYINSLQDYYRKRAEDYIDPASPPDDHVEPDPGYIHLSDASYIVHGQFTTQKGVFWRGPLTSVDGFIMGGTSNAPR